VQSVLGYDPAEFLGSGGPKALGCRVRIGIERRA